LELECCIPEVSLHSINHFPSFGSVELPSILLKSSLFLLSISPFFRLPPNTFFSLSQDGKLQSKNYRHTASATNLCVQWLGRFPFKEPQTEIAQQQWAPVKKRFALKKKMAGQIDLDPLPKHKKERTEQDRN
jgi:hypothetical protein